MLGKSKLDWDAHVSTTSEKEDLARHNKDGYGDVNQDVAVFNSFYIATWSALHSFSEPKRASMKMSLSVARGGLRVDKLFLHVTVNLSIAGD